MATISFYGGVGSVTGSKYLLQHNGKKVLVDCGLFQGERELRERNWQAPPFDPQDLDAVVITHAHIDHTGYLPRVVSLGYDRKAFSPRTATADLLKILLPDSGRLQEEEAEYRNRKGLTRHTPALPLYDENDAKDALKLLHPVPNDGEFVEICEGFQRRVLRCRTYYGRESRSDRNSGREGKWRAAQISFFRRFGTLRPADYQRPGDSRRVRLPDGRIDLRQPPARRVSLPTCSSRKSSTKHSAKRADSDSGFCRRAHAGDFVSDSRARRSKKEFRFCRSSSIRRWRRRRRRFTIAGTKSTTKNTPRF